MLYDRVEKEVGGMEMAHEGMIWSLAWHPLGHILCSGSNDHTRYIHTQCSSAPYIEVVHKQPVCEVDHTALLKIKYG